MESIWFSTRSLPDIPPSEADGRRFDTVVAGGGLTGLTTAALLARSGQRVGLIEARRLGAVTTGHTTGKVSLLQGDVLSRILEHHDQEMLRAYVDANKEGAAWLLRLLDDREVPYQRRTAYTYALSTEGRARLESEVEASRQAGLDVTWTNDPGLPFEVAGAIRLEDQAQIHPLEVLSELVRELAEHGAQLFENTRLLDVSTAAQLQITTSRGEMVADRLVLATGTAVLDRGGYFARQVPLRSYALTFRLPDGTPPQGMYLSVDEPTRSLRSVPIEGGELLMVGGNGHVVGRSDSPADAMRELKQWTQQHFPGAEQQHAWGAQDYRAFDGLPHVGLLPGGDERIYVATGYNKWGMSNAIAAALNLSGQILGGSMAWARTLTERPPDLRGVVEAVTGNAAVAWELGKGLVEAELHALPKQPPAEGDGVVGRGTGGKPHGVSTVNGRTCVVSAVCSHMGGVLRWNDAERSWDCPLHGSRFTPDGEVLEGPAVRDLERTE